MKPEPQNPNFELLKKLHAKMLGIRRVEEAIADAYGAQEMKCPIHLSIGQEAVPVGLCEHLGNDDRVYSTHRCHAHYLAKNGSIPAMIAELYGKSTGCAKGKGGSMHLVQPATGMMGSSALVGGTIPLAVGSAMSFSLEKKPHVSVAYFGDGASEEGIFYESLNFAALKNLPVIFACENNHYATYSHQNARQASESIFQRAAGFGLPSIRVDGNDVEAVYKATGIAVARGRNGEGPTLFEFVTYRWRDHVGPTFDFNVGYRTQEDVEKWMADCPIERLEKKLLAQGILTVETKQALEATIQQKIAEAFAFAKASPTPDPKEIYTDIYA